MESTNESNLFELQVDHNGSAFLKEAAKWAKFLAIVGFIFIGFFVLIAIFGGAAIARVSSLGSANSGMATMGAGAVTIIYLLIALLYFFPCLYLYNFAAKMQIALRNNDLEQLNVSFKNLKSYFKFLGILTLIGLCLAVIGLIFGVIAAGMAFRQ